MTIADSVSSARFFHRRRWIAGVGAAVLVAATLGGWAAGQPKRGNELVREVELPAGTYTSLIVSAFGGTDSRSWVVYLQPIGEQPAPRTLPIIVRGGESFEVPFSRGWRVEAKSWRVSISPDSPTAAVTVWGVTEKGPVALTP